jgi:hypothetical protein
MREGLYHRDSGSHGLPNELLVPDLTRTLPGDCATMKVLS